MKPIFIFLLLSILHSQCDDIHQAEIQTETQNYNNLPQQSLYRFEGNWVNQYNDSVCLNDFQNKTIVASFIFTYCESACPILITDIKQMEEELTHEQKKSILFLLISIDPERDTPERLRKICKRYNLDQNWMLIASNENVTTELENVFGVRVKKLPNGGFDHSNIIYVINKDGIVIHQIKGLNQDNTEALSKIKQELQS